MEASDQLGGGTPQEGLIARVRARPWVTVGIAAGTILVLAWLAWAVYVAADRGAREALGVLIAWPVLIVAAALIALPFIGIYFLVRRRNVDDSSGTKPSKAPADDSSKESGETEEAEATSSG